MSNLSDNDNSRSVTTNFSNDSNYGIVGNTDPNVCDVDFNIRKRRIFEGVIKK